MAKISLSPVTGGYNLAAINTNFTQIAAALNNGTLWRNNPIGEPNQMSNTLDMNSNRIYNLPAPILPHEAARYQEIQEIIERYRNALQEGGNGQWEGEGKRINNLAGGIASSDAANIGQVVQGDQATESRAEATANRLDNLVRQYAEALVANVQPGAGTGAFQHLGPGAQTRTFQEKERDVFNVFDYMLSADRMNCYLGLGTVDVTYAVNLAVAVLVANRITSPAGSTWGNGLGKIKFTRGRFLINGSVTCTNASALSFEGDGTNSTVLQRTVDTGSMFNFTTYMQIKFSDLSADHISDITNAVTKAAWTSNFLTVNGTGAGAGMVFDRVNTKGFNRVINYTATNANEDTNMFTGCRFYHFNTFIYTRSSQAIINQFTQCTWFGTVNDVFNVSGYGHTQFDTCNVVISGVFLHLYPGSTGPQSNYICNNVKFEFWPQAGGMVGTTQLIKMEGAQSNAYIEFNGGGLAGSTPDPTVFQLDLRGNSQQVRFKGGSWSPDMKIRVSNDTPTGATPLSNSVVLFENAQSSPLPSNITFASGGNSISYTPVVWRNCVARVNLCLTGSAGGNTINSSVSGHYLKNINSTTGNPSGGVITGQGNVTHAFPHYGQKAIVRDVHVTLLGSSGAITNGHIRVYSDAAKTNLISNDVAIPSPSTITVPIVHTMVIPASTIITEGVYVEVSNANGTFLYGRVVVETESV